MITHHPVQVQENPGFAVLPGVAILGRPAKTNLEVAASRRWTSPACKDVVSSSIAASVTFVETSLPFGGVPFKFDLGRTGEPIMSPILTIDTAFAVFH